MQTSISKRLLAGLLSIVMVLSLFIATPAKTEAGATNRNLCTINLFTDFGEVLYYMNAGVETPILDAAGKEQPVLSWGLYDGVTAGDIKIGGYVQEYTDITDATKVKRVRYEGILKGDRAAALLDGPYISINNGSFKLDTDDEFDITQTTNTITIKFMPLHMEDWKDLAGVQVYLGNAASAWAKAYNGGYEKADFKFDASGYIVVTVQTTPQNEEIDAANIASLKTNIYYQYYFSNYKELKGVVDLMFTQSPLTWKYTENGDEVDPKKIKWTYPTYPILNSAPEGQDECYYAVEMIVSALPGYEFPTTEAGITALNNELDTITAARADVRQFRISDVSRDGQTAKLTISKIYPVLHNSMIDPSITSIELSKQLNFGTNQVNNVADAKVLMPKSFVVTLNGEKKIIDISSLLASKRIEWAIYTVSGGSLAKLEDKDLINKSEFNNNGVLTTAAQPYYAVLEWVDPAWDPYKIVPEYGVMAPVYAGIFYAGGQDEHKLLKAYVNDTERKANQIKDADHTAWEATANDLQTLGWAIEFSVNGGKSYGGMVDQPTEGLKENSAPTIMFNGFGENYTMTAYGAGKAHSAHATAADALTGTWTDLSGAQNTLSPCPAGDHYYKAYLEAIANVYTESPVVYAWFDPKAGLTHEAKQGAVSVTVTTPDKYVAVPYTVNTIEGSMDLATADPDCPFAYDKTELYWEGEVASGNSGENVFLSDSDYTAIIAVPVKAGYTLTFTPEVRFNGYVADEVELTEIDGITYLLAAYTFNKTDKFWHVEKDYVYKKLRFSGLGTPYAGGVVPRTLTPTESAARFYEFADITWYENGEEYDGATFQLGKRYTAVVTFDCSKFNIKEDNIVVSDIVATLPAKAVSAKILKKDAVCEVRYEFAQVEEKKLVGVDVLEIEVPYGMSKDSFYTYLAGVLYPVALFADGTTGVARVGMVYFTNGETFDFDYTLTAPDIMNMFDMEYPGILGYDPNKTSAQDFAFMVEAEATPNQTATTMVYIHVSGQKQAVIFDGNGGTSVNTGALVETGMPYGFKYVPAEIYRDGYFFAGWFDAPTGGNRIYSKTIFDGKVKVLYAHWVKVFTGKVWTMTAKSYAAGRLTVVATKPKTKVDGYEFSYSKDGVNWTVITQTKNTAYITGLESKGTYSVKVRAYRIDSAGKFVYGAYSTVKKVTVK